MPLHIYIVSLLLQEVIGLKVSNQVGLESCRDLSMEQSEIGAMVRSVHTYFQQQGVTVYPAVLTMVAAMRYGSVSAPMPNKHYLDTLVDHDLDFMLVFPEPTHLLQVHEKILGFTSYLRNVSGMDSKLTDWTEALAVWKSSPETEWATTWFEPLWGSSVKKNFHMINVEVQKSTKLTEKLNRDGLMAEGRMYTKRFWEFQGTDKLNIPKTLLQDKFGYGQMHHDTWINLWMPKEYTSDYKASPTKKTFFMGEVFPFPNDDNTIFKVLVDEFGSFHKASKGTSLCDFSYPHGLYEEDMKESPATFQLAKKCTMELQEKGFASFANCDNLKSSN